ncbi:uncharacterized protein LOC122756623 [Drosophila santomea]|uniref:uncharacterized protein LOC122756623 n=1 Tax=Drosophila santomea TaxID=129105 RepID=UPI001CCDD232|nr:uncharacterized protein LOC122756623 [Drosophila santomea]
MKNVSGSGRTFRMTQSINADTTLHKKAAITRFTASKMGKYVSVCNEMLMLFGMIYVDNYRNKPCSGIYLTLTSFYRLGPCTSWSSPRPRPRTHDAPWTESLMLADGKDADAKGTPRKS